MSKDIEKYDPIFNISEADKAVAKYLTPWTPSGLLIIIYLFIILLHSVHAHTALAGDAQGTGSVVARHVQWSLCMRACLQGQSVLGRPHARSRCVLRACVHGCHRGNIISTGTFSSI